MIQIVSLSDVEPAQSSALLDRAFGAGRLQRTAALVRAGATPIPAACLALLDHGVLVGSVAVHRLFWCPDEGAVRPLAWLGPLARDPERHGEGLGIALMERALAQLDAIALPVALVGDAPYYRRWGFSAEATGHWAMPGPVDGARLLLRASDADAFACPAILRTHLPARASA